VVLPIDTDHGLVVARKPLGKGKPDSRGAAGNDARSHVLASPLVIYLLTVVSTETIAPGVTQCNSVPRGIERRRAVGGATLSI
jgi:hypothetical protein